MSKLSIVRKAARLALVSILSVAIVSPAIAEGTRTAFVSNFGSSNVSALDIAAAGGLSALSGSPFAAGSQPSGVAVSPDGNHLYVTNRSSNNVSAYAIAADGGLNAVSGAPFSAGATPIGVAASPAGNHLYVTNNASNNVSAYAIAADGSLSALSGSPFAAGSQPSGVAVSPDGSHLYVTNLLSNNVSAYAIAADGSLSAVSGSPFAAGATPFGVAVSPDGSHLFVANNASNNVSAYAIAADGSLSAVGGSPFPAGSLPTGVAASPDDSHLYVTNDNSDDVSAYAIAADGSLSPLSGSPFVTGGTGPNFQSIAITPNQPPVASFTATPAEPGSPTSFDASASTDPDGTIATYAWDFGDGTTLASGGPTPTHTYASPGSYEVTLTLTDDEGCSTQIVYTGQTASCNGKPTAAQTKAVQIEAAPPVDEPPVITNLKVSPKSFAVSGKSTPTARKRGAQIKLTLSEDASVRLRIRRNPPRRKGGPPPRNPRVMTRALSEGPNLVPFSGKLDHHSFRPGRYLVVARATDSANQRSERVKAKFQITGG